MSLKNKTKQKTQINRIVSQNCAIKKVAVCHIFKPTFTEDS